MSHAERALADLVRGIDPTFELIASQTLEGGVSATIQALDVRTPAGTKRWVLRTLPDDPDLDAATEYALLRWLAGHHFPIAPALACIAPGPGRPQGAVLLERIEGAVDQQPVAARIDRISTLLAQLHDLPTADLGFLPPMRAHPLPESWPSLDPARVAPLRHAARLNPPVSGGAEVLCHGDFWSGNLLWRADGSVAVLDWEDARKGDRLHDLAVARLEMVWQTGTEAMERLTDSYLAHCSRSGLDSAEMRARLPAWDLAVTLLRLAWLPGWGLPAATRDWCLGVGLAHAEGAAARL